MGADTSCAGPGGVSAPPRPFRLRNTATVDSATDACQPFRYSFRQSLLGQLSHALDQEGVVAAMLIGSQARGNPGPLSDVDIAVWHDPDLDSRGRFDLQLSLADDAGRALGTDEIDVVMLNHAPPLMRHRAIRDGKRLVERDHDERVRLETRAVLDYLDTAPLRTELGRGVRRRIREGRFGRR